MERQDDMLAFAARALPAFEKATYRISVADIKFLRPVSSRLRQSVKYATISASIKEVGVIEPPVVARDPQCPGKYLLLDGRIRIEVLQQLGTSEVACLMATEDEAFTYNKRISRLATVQENQMIVRALERGVPEVRLAKALNIDVRTIQQKRRLLAGVCPEAIDMLKDRHVSSPVFWVLKKMVPLRQIEVADLMIAMNKFSAIYAKSLLLATPQSQLVESARQKSVKGLTAEQMAMMEKESANLEQEFKVAERSYGTDHLHLVLAKGYLAKLLSNAKVVRYLAQQHQDILHEFQKIAELDRGAA